MTGLIHLCQARARIDVCSEISTSHVEDVIALVKYSKAAQVKLEEADGDGSGASTSGNSRGKLKRFIQMLEMRSSALNRRIFEFDELKDMARRVGISCGVTNLIDMVNLQGILLKKGPNMYELITD